MHILLIRAAQAGLALALLMQAQASRGRVEEYKARFIAESSPVRKARIIEKLGDAQFDFVRQRLDAGDVDGALRTLTDYHDECLATHQALKGAVSDPERKPSGFKELELSVRENLSRLREIMTGLPKEEQDRFAPIRSDLDELNRQLILELFPRQPKSSARSNGNS